MGQEQDEGLIDKSPRELSQLHLELAQEYGVLSDELGKILQLKDINWMILRGTCTSDRQCDRLWHTTEPGREERMIELRMKKIQKLMSSINIYLRVKSDESRNQY